MPHKLMMPTGVLKKRAEAYKKITNAVLLGSLEGENFTDVEVVTLSQYARDCAYKESLTSDHFVTSYEDLQVQVETLLNTQFKEAHEFISVEEDRVIVGVDAEIVNDQAVDKALMLLIEVEDFARGSYHVFGDPIKINAKP